MFIGKLTVEHVCHSERSEKSLIFSGPVAHKSKPRCFASLNMTLAIYRCPDGQSGIARAAGLSNDFSFFEMACFAEIEPATVASMKKLLPTNTKQRSKARTQPPSNLSFTHKAQTPGPSSFTK